MASPLKHVGDSRIAAVRETKSFEATCDLKRLSEVDVVVICVPTPLGHHREPDLSFVINTTQEIAQCLRPGQLIVLESTTYPGTTTEIVRPILESTGLKSGRDFFWHFRPSVKIRQRSISDFAIPRLSVAMAFLLVSWRVHSTQPLSTGLWRSRQLRLLKP